MLWYSDHDSVTIMITTLKTARLHGRYLHFTRTFAVMIAQALYSYKQ